MYALFYTLLVKRQSIFKFVFDAKKIVRHEVRRFNYKQPSYFKKN